MKTLVVGMADCSVSDDSSAILVSYALGSCVAVAIYDSVARVGGLLHFMLPGPGTDAAKAAANPFMYAETGLPKLLQQAYSLGAHKNRLVLWLAGGAQIMDHNGAFNIGKRNHTSVRNLLWKLGIPIHAESVGGVKSRTVGLELRDGRFWVREEGMVEQDLAPLRAQMRRT